MYQDQFRESAISHSCISNIVNQINETVRVLGAEIRQTIKAELIAKLSAVAEGVNALTSLNEVAPPNSILSMALSSAGRRAVPPEHPLYKLCLFGVTLGRALVLLNRAVANPIKELSTIIRSGRRIPEVQRQGITELEFLATMDPHDKGALDQFIDHFVDFSHSESLGTAALGFDFQRAVYGLDGCIQKTLSKLTKLGLRRRRGGDREDILVDRIKIDRGKCIITLDREPIEDLRSDACEFIQALVDANGGWITTKEINQKYPDFKKARWDRVHIKLPKPIRDLVQSFPGCGYRIRLA